jgi:hypothetical protein
MAHFTLGVLSRIISARQGRHLGFDEEPDDAHRSSNHHQHVEIDGGGQHVIQG